MVFTSDGKQNKEVDTWVGEKKHNSALLFHGNKRRSFKHRCAVIFISGFVSIPTSGHEFCVVTKRVLSQVEAAEIDFL